MSNPAANRGPEWRVHLLWILALWTVALLVRLPAAALAVAPARDALRYVSAAKSFVVYPFRTAIEALDTHPLYPAALLAAKTALTSLGAPDEPAAWINAGTVVGIASHLAFIAAAYLASMQLWNARVAGFGCLALSLTPRQISYSIDMLSDGLHAAFWMTSFAMLLYGWRRRSPWLLTLSGFFAAMGYWTRPESLLLPCVAVATFAAAQIVPAWRWPMRQAAACLALYLAAFAIPAGAYVALAGKISPRNSADALLNRPTKSEPTAAQQTTGYERPVEQRRHSSTRVIQDWFTRPYTHDENYEFLPWGRAMLRLMYEIGQETRGWLLALAVFACFTTNRSRMRWPAGAFAAIAFCGQLSLLMILQMRAGYVAGRYLTPVLPFVATFAITGIESLVAWTRNWRPLPWERCIPAVGVPRLRAASTVGLVVVTALALCLPSWLHPLHRYRHAYLDAADWIGVHTERGERVFDPLGVVSFFADRKRWAPKTGEEPIPVRYAIVDAERLYRTELPNHQVLRRFHESGRIVATFRQRKSDKDLLVHVVEMLPQTAAQPSNPERR